LEYVSHFIVVIESESFQGQSWIVQCKILEQ
jgi:stress-induced morphogen